MNQEWGMLVICGLIPSIAAVIAWHYGARSGKMRILAAQDEARRAHAMTEFRRPLEWGRVPEVPREEIERVRLAILIAQLEAAMTASTVLREPALHNASTVVIERAVHGGSAETDEPALTTVRAVDQERAVLSAGAVGHDPAVAIGSTVGHDPAVAIGSTERVERAEDLESTGNPERTIGAGSAEVREFVLHWLAHWQDDGLLALTGQRAA